MAIKLDDRNMDFMENCIILCRIVARKPKDVWAVRLTLGTFLMDGKYFKPLDLDE